MGFWLVMTKSFAVITAPIIKFSGIALERLNEKNKASMSLVFDNFKFRKSAKDMF